MGLDFNYRVYVKKENLVESLKYIYDKCSNGNSSNVFQDSKTLNLKNLILSLNTPNQKIIEDVLKEKYLGGFSFPFNRDSTILEYILTRSCSGFSHEDEISYRPSLKDNVFSIGNIEIAVEDYSKKIPDVVEISFTAVTSKMSILFKESKSVDSFFKILCKEVSAEYGCLDKEHEGYRLIWFEGEEYSINIPHAKLNSSNQPFHKYGFIPVLKMILKKDKST